MPIEDASPTALQVIAEVLTRLDGQEYTTHQKKSASLRAFKILSALHAAGLAVVNIEEEKQAEQLSKEIH